jgi:hypothetical protein
MFPDKPSDTRILLEYFRIAIFIRIDSSRSFYGKIINEYIGNGRNLIPQDKNHALLEFCGGVGVTHGHAC